MILQYMPVFAAGLNDGNYFGNPGRQYLCSENRGSLDQGDFWFCGVSDACKDFFQFMICLIRSFLSCLQYLSVFFLSVP